MRQCRLQRDCFYTRRHVKVFRAEVRHRDIDRVASASRGCGGECRRALAQIRLRRVVRIVRSWHRVRQVAEARRLRKPVLRRELAGREQELESSTVLAASALAWGPELGAS